MKKLILGLVLGMLIGSATVAFAASDLVGTKVQAVFASFNLVINGEAKELSAVPLVYNGTSYLPVRDIANLTGFDVTYKADSRTIELNKAVDTVTIKTNSIKDVSAMTVITNGSLIKGRTLIELLAKKYPAYSKEIRLLPDGTLKFNNQEIILTKQSDERLDAAPLIDQNIVTLDELNAQ